MKRKNLSEKDDSNTNIFHGFVVLWFHGFMVSPTPNLGHRNDYSFHGFVVSSFRALHSWTIGFMVSCTPNLGYPGQLENLTSVYR